LEANDVRHRGSLSTDFPVLNPK